MPMIHHLTTTTTTTLFIKSSSSLPFAQYEYEYADVHKHNLQNPRPRPRPRRRSSISQWSIPPRCCSKKEQVYTPTPPRAKRSSNNGIITGDFGKSKSKEIYVATLGNLCVDIVLNVPELPPNDPALRKLYMDRLSASPPDKQYWEAGGNCNMAIAAGRIGLDCITIGHVGHDIYGRFLLDVLHHEGISMVGMMDTTQQQQQQQQQHSDHLLRVASSYQTLLCWVLVDPLQRHGFCSRADFSDQPAFSWLTTLSNQVKMAIQNSKILFCNGYGFDELSPHMLTSALHYAVDVGTSVFFDPGPRGNTLSNGTPQQQTALSHFLTMSDVLLLTSDEAEALTGIKNPILAGQELLKKGVRTKWVIVKMGSRGSIIISMSSISCAPAFKVNVIDTVGCGDSFVAAIAFGFIHNMPMISSLALANAVGAATAMGCGAGRNVATLQRVIELMKTAELNEDEEFWNELLAEEVDTEDITFLSKFVVNGNNHQLNRIALQKVVSELLPKLESSPVEGKVPS